MSNLLLFDIGNSRLKWSCVESDRNPNERQKKLWSYSGAIDTKLLDSEEHRTELAHYIKVLSHSPSELVFAVWLQNPITSHSKIC